MKQWTREKKMTSSTWTTKLYRKWMRRLKTKTTKLFTSMGPQVEKITISKLSTKRSSAKVTNLAKAKYSNSIREKAMPWPRLTTMQTPFIALTRWRHPKEPYLWAETSRTRLTYGNLSPKVKLISKLKSPKPTRLSKSLKVRRLLNYLATLRL